MGSISDNRDDWLEKHRPSSVADMALHDHQRKLLQVLLEADRLPHHLLLWGPSGTGKTSVTRLLVQHFVPEDEDRYRVRRINAAEARGIEAVRSDLLPWMRAGGGILGQGDPQWWALIVLSEADGLTADAQRVLNDVMDLFGDRYKFVLTTNVLDGLLPSIRSRCKVLEMGPPPIEERARVLATILERESVAADPSSVMRMAHHFEDMRELVREAQVSVAVHGDLRVPTNHLLNLWPDPVDGAVLLFELKSMFERYLSLPPHASTLLPLWTLFSHAHDAFQVSPVLAITSPVKRSGKTTCLNLLGRVVPDPLFASNMSLASVYRALTEKVWTLVADEADTWFNKDDQMRGIWNSGHTRDLAWAVRADGGHVTLLPTWGPKVLSLIRRDQGDLPSTIQDRSVVISMRRAKRDEPILALSLDRIGEDLQPLRQKAARWAFDHLEELRASRPDVPSELNHRARDNWRPLLAIADLVGGPWPRLARVAAKVVSGAGDESDEIALLALADLRETFALEKADRLPSALIVDRLQDLPDRAWAGWLTPQRLAVLLRPFGVRPKPLWTVYGTTRERTLQGYFLMDCEDAFARYLPPRSEGQG